MTDIKPRGGKTDLPGESGLRRFTGGVLPSDSDSSPALRFSFILLRFNLLNYKSQCHSVQLV